MSNVIPFPIIARPIPVDPDDEAEPHTVALKTLDLWVGYATKRCVPGWAEKALADRLWRLKARKMFAKGEK